VIQGHYKAASVQAKRGKGTAKKVNVWVMNSRHCSSYSGHWTP